MCPNPQIPADLVTSIENIVNGKLHFLCSELLTLSFPQGVLNPKNQKLHIFLQSL